MGTHTDYVTLEVTMRVKIKANSISALDALHYELRHTGTLVTTDGGEAKIEPLLMTRNALRDKWLEAANKRRTEKKVKP